MKAKSWSVSLVVALLAIVSCAVPQPAASQALRAEAGAYQLEVLVDGAPVRTFRHDGETHVLGQEGRRYVLRVHNHSGRRIEAVISVDGLDVIDGKAGDFAHKRGYLVPAYGYVDVDGWRLSDREAAAFRFSAIGESYAAKTGAARNVGVIGVAVFPERIVRPLRPAYVPAPSYDDDGFSSLGGARRGSGAGRVEGYGASREREVAPVAAAAEARPQSSKGEAAAADEALSAAPAARMPKKRSGLGTEFGEAVSSEIRQVEFVRASARQPQTFLGARYNDRAGLYALGIDVDGREPPSELDLRQSANPFPQSPGRFARPPVDWRHR